MGQLITRLVTESPDFELVASLSSGSSLDSLLESDIVVDVTVPAVSQSIVDFAIDNGKNVLVGTSGWSASRITTLTNRVAALAVSPAVIIIPNFSVGSVLATSFAAIAARFYDSMEIIEAHHFTKVDSPSGTAVRTAELMGNARATRGPVIAPHADQRARGQQVSSIPIHSMRMHGIVAKQDVIFGGTGETLTLSHETLDPSSYEAGIMLALRALAGSAGGARAGGVTVGLDKLIDLSPIPVVEPAAAQSDLE